MTRIPLSAVLNGKIDDVCQMHGVYVKVIQDFVKQMRLRDQGMRVKEFAKTRNLNARSFATIATNFDRAMQEGKLTQDELLNLFLKRSLFGHKRVMLLREAPKDISTLGEPAPPYISLLPVTGKAATRPIGSKKMPGFYLGPKKFDGIDVHIFATARKANEREEVEYEELTEEARKYYEGAKITARLGEAIRCFDLILELDGRHLLLIDSPPTIEALDIKQDISLYRRALESQGNSFIDFWPAVQAIYGDSKEGALNYVRFESSNRVQMSGAYSRLQSDDYRKLPYHVAGSAVGPVQVFAIGVRWNRDGEDAPYVALPGTRNMLTRELINGEWYPPLRHMEFPLPTTSTAFQFAAKKVLKRLP